MIIQQTQVARPWKFVNEPTRSWSFGAHNILAIALAVASINKIMKKMNGCED